MRRDVFSILAETSKSSETSAIYTVLLAFWYSKRVKCTSPQQSCDFMDDMTLVVADMLSEEKHE